MTEIRDSMPVHPYRGPARGEAEAVLRIDGLVRRPLEARAADLAGMSRIEHTEAFACEEGWTVPAVRWRGVRLADVVSLADPLPSARYVRVHAGGYVVPVELVAAGDALLCEEMNGQPLPAAHGAPWRLLVRGGACFTSVKWVDRLELAATAGPREGERIARERRGMSA